MKLLIENQLQKWFGMSLNTALEVLIVASFTLLIAITMIFAIISLAIDPSVADSASWGFAD